MNQTVHNQSQKPSDDNYIQVLLNQISLQDMDMIFHFALIFLEKAADLHYHLL